MLVPPWLPSLVPRFAVLFPLLVSIAACGGGGDSGPTVTTPGTVGAPAAIQILEAPSITLTSGTSRTLTTIVSDKDGHQITGASIVWTSTDLTIVSTDGATVTGIKVGTATIGASIGSIHASIDIRVTPGQIAQLAIRTQPGGAVVGTALSTQPVLEFRDAAGNLVPAGAGFVSAAIASGGGSLGGTTTVQASGGVVTFTDLKIVGTSGPRTLSFSAGTLAATSSSFSVDPSPTPFMVADSSAVSIALQGIGDSATRTITIVNAGSQPLSGITAAVNYDGGPALGWLSARLSSPNAPTVLTLVANAGALAAGTYHATVQITGPGASNSPLSIGVSLTVAPQYTFSYGAATEKVKVLDIGASFSPAVTIVDGTGAPVKNVPLSFASRASSIATVGSDGKITAVAGGDAWVVASSPAGSDSIFVIVPRSATAPMLLTDATNSTSKVGDTLFVNVLFDTRGTPVGAASLSAEILLQSGSLSYSYLVPSSSPTPVVNLVSSGLFRISIGAATGFTGSVQVLKLKIVGRSVNTIGWLNLFALDVSAVDGSSLTAQTTATRLPLVIR